MEPEAKKLKLDDEEPTSSCEKPSQETTQMAENSDQINTEKPPAENDVLMVDSDTDEKTSQEKLDVIEIKDDADNDEANTEEKPDVIEIKDDEDNNETTLEGKSEAANGETSTGKGSVCREIDVGITEYISQHEGFTAIIKQR